MRIGVMILPDSTWGEACQRWRAADELGFAHAWTYDHVVWRDRVGKPWFAALPTLAAVAMVTRSVSIGTLVSSPNFRHPVPFAKEVETLQDISSGRFVLGIGSGASGHDAEILGKAPQPVERRRRFAEFVEAMDRLLDPGEGHSAGDGSSAGGVTTAPGRPAGPRVPIAVAGSTPLSMQLAARHAAIWVTNGRSPRPGFQPPMASVPMIRDQIRALDDVCRAEGRSPSGLRRLLLNVSRESPVLDSLDALENAIGEFSAVGVTDMVLPFPGQDPFGGRMDVLEAACGRGLLGGQPVVQP
jgi:alkanesulfonate monooxygenase SsuD/methylene tetrahydromethanopterin reductase-like flavin-dependent oxidoreductase (luciferase family)